MKNNEVMKEYVAPIAVLVIICFCVTAALAMTYGITKPIIDTNAKATADAARQELLAEADGFTPYDGELSVPAPGAVEVTECYVANNQAGLVATVSSKGFGGPVTIMVGINADGEVTGVKVTDHAETPGLGDKNMTPEYLEQYKGRSSLNSSAVKQEGGDFKYISGASVTGGAVHYAVFAALDQFSKMGGVK